MDVVICSLNLQFSCGSPVTNVLVMEEDGCGFWWWDRVVMGQCRGSDDEGEEERVLVKK